MAEWQHATQKLLFDTGCNSLHCNTGVITSDCQGSPIQRSIRISGFHLISSLSSKHVCTIPLEGFSSFLLGDCVQFMSFSNMPINLAYSNTHIDTQIKAVHFISIEHVGRFVAVKCWVTTASKQEVNRRLVSSFIRTPSRTTRSLFTQI